jgi:uncharacterized UBP type Zn finger protein
VHAAAAAQAAGAWPQQSAALYQLRAVVRHKGPLASSGHFVSEVLSDQQVGADVADGRLCKHVLWLDLHDLSVEMHLFL